ncbi:unnamed protein product [Orchesella dallaii]|uniref:Uncharacterized protein n=1 Tax=Orchesella dallaii TaxID=48710 RepID=A0ABP1QTC4_9HEXA
MTGLGMQYVMDPKGITFTGSLLESDSFLVTFLLGLHEEICLISVWYQAVAIILIPVLVGSELTICLRFLRKELNQLQLQSTPVNRQSKTGDAEGQATEHTFKKPSNGEQNSYRIEDILFHYQCLQLVGDRLQDISSFIFLITQIIYFAQITSDVFVGIQLWRIGDNLSVTFYASDCTSGMGYWFFSLYSIGRLDEEMINFRKILISYFRREYKKRSLHLKVLKSFREISVFLGPSPILRGTSAKVIYDLFGYYILAALW